jgi:hypothetical protein
MAIEDGRVPELARRELRTQAQTLTLNPRRTPKLQSTATAATLGSPASVSSVSRCYAVPPTCESDLSLSSESRYTLRCQPNLTAVEEGDRRCTPHHNHGTCCDRDLHVLCACTWHSLVNLFWNTKRTGLERRNRDTKPATLSLLPLDFLGYVGRYRLKLPHSVPLSRVPRTRHAAVQRCIL